MSSLPFSEHIIFLTSTCRKQKKSKRSSSSEANRRLVVFFSWFVGVVLFFFSLETLSRGFYTWSLKPTHSYTLTHIHTWFELRFKCSRCFFFFCFTHQKHLFFFSFCLVLFCFVRGTRRFFFQPEVTNSKHLTTARRLVFFKCAIEIKDIRVRMRSDCTVAYRPAAKPAEYKTHHC